MTRAAEGTLRLLLLPGWQGSGPDHWQTRWSRHEGFAFVEQDDWQWPRRGDWMARLDQVVADGASPVALVAHSLGCHLVAAWAAHSQLHARVRAALLVAPPDLARPDVPPQLYSWRPPVLARLPFASILVASSDDPYASVTATRAMAEAWGAQFREAGAHGHLNADSGLGEWPDGRALLHTLLGPPAGS